jgi:Ca2+-binding EF-hand superfamily protein
LLSPCHAGVSGPVSKEKNMSIALGLSVLGKVVSALRSNSNPSGEKKVNELFSKLDKDGNGGISRSELADFQSILASESKPRNPAALLAKVFDRVDTDTNGEVSPEELKAARELMTEQARRLSGSDLWTRIFNNLDKDGDGKVSQAEMQAALQDMQGRMQGVATNGPASILDYLGANPQNQVSGTSALV